MSDTPAAPTLAFLATMNVTVAEPTEIGTTREGQRRIIPITGGTISGPHLRGKVLPVGADFQLLRSSTVTEMEAKYAIETDDNERIYVHNFALRTGPEHDIARLVRGEKTDPSRIYFRSSFRLTATGEKWSWLDSKIVIGSGERFPSEVRIHIFVVE